jgi:hypothetical protein
MKGDKPLPTGNMGILENAADGYGKLLPAFFGLAL